MERQDELFIPTAEMARGAGHPFDTKLNEVLTAVGFDPFVEELCASFCRESGQPGIPPGAYFRMLFSGYFEGSDTSGASPGELRRRSGPARLPGVWPLLGGARA